ncbi:MAG: GNAT family N-acetyltransferase [Rhodocyclaceae bacterium]|nr:GNAT family N-acetyltransferase [Rhodocyclaceae bacterium]
MTQIREATATDGPAIVGLLDELGYPGGGAFVARRVTQLLAHPDAVLLVACDGARVEGLISLHFIPQLALDGDFCRISYLCVTEGARGRGIGQALEARATALARERGCDRIELHCAELRTAAHAFYEAQGYRHAPRYFVKSVR